MSWLIFCNSWLSVTYTIWHPGIGLLSCVIWFLPISLQTLSKPLTLQWVWRYRYCVFDWRFCVSVTLTCTSGSCGREQCVLKIIHEKARVYEGFYLGLSRLFMQNKDSGQMYIWIFFSFVNTVMQCSPAQCVTLQDIILSCRDKCVFLTDSQPVNCHSCFYA